MHFLCDCTTYYGLYIWSKEDPGFDSSSVRLLKKYFTVVTPLQVIELDDAILSHCQSLAEPIIKIRQILNTMNGAHGLFGGFSGLYKQENRGELNKTIDILATAYQKFSTHNATIRQVIRVLRQAT